MGVQSSGATLEIQLVADVARLKSDMANMQSVVANATGNAGASFTKMGSTSAAAATAMAAAAQQSARAAVVHAEGLGTVGKAAHLTTLELRETLVATRELYQGNLTRLPGSLTLLSQSISEAGGIKAYGAALLSTLGILTTLQDTELAEVAAQKAAVAASVENSAARAANAVVARQAQVTIAQAQLAAAGTAEEEAAAQATLVKALRSVELAAERAAIAQKALAVAEEESSVAGAEAVAASKTRLTALGVAVASVGTVAALAFGAWLVERLMDTGRAVEKLVEKLDEKYQKTLDEAEANRIWAESLNGVAEAMGKVADETAKQFTTPDLKRVLEMQDAQSKLGDALKQQAQAQKDLAVARVKQTTPQVGIGQGGMPMPDPDADTRVKKALETLNSANAAVANATRALHNLEIATAVDQGKALSDSGTAFGKFVDDVVANLERLATNSSAPGKAMKAGLTSDVAALEALRKSFSEAAASTDPAVAKMASGVKTRTEEMADALIKGSEAPPQFAKSVTAMAADLGKAAKDTKDAISKFEAGVGSLEGTGPNRMGSNARGFFQFEPGTWLHLFDKVYPQFAKISEAAKLAQRDTESVAKGILDAYARENAAYLTKFGQAVTATNLMLAHRFGAKGAVELLQAAPGAIASQVLGLNAKTVEQNKLQGKTVAEVQNAIASAFGESSAAIAAGSSALEKWNIDARHAVDELDVQIAGQLGLARAYTDSDVAAIKAEAAQKAAQITLQKHADAAMAATFQEKELQDAVAKNAVEAGHRVAQLRDESVVRKFANDNVESGAISYRKLSETMQDEAALAPLLALQAIATGDAYNAITNIIEKYRKTLHDAHAEEDRGAAITKVGEANEQYKEAIALLGAEAQLTGVNKDQRDEILKLLKQELELRQQFPGMTEEQIHQITLETAAEDNLRRHLDQVEAGMDQLRQTGESMIDTVFNIDNWKNPLDLALQLVKQLEQEFVTLAFANPLKNKLFGDNLPTLDSVGGVKGFLGGLTGKKADLSAAGAQLATAGASLNTASGSLGSVATIWQGVALQIQAAAAELAAAGSTGGGFSGGMLGNLLGGSGGTLGSLFSAAGGAGGLGDVASAAAATDWTSLAAGLTFADGGFVSGRGGPTSDSIPAMLSNGEYVMSAATVRKFGAGYLDMMNSGHLPHKKGGGLLDILQFVSPLAFLANHDALKYLSPAAFLGDALFGSHHQPKAPPLAANQNQSSNNTFHIHVAAPNTGDPVRDRQTSLQQAADIRSAIAGAARKGLI